MTVRLLPILAVVTLAATARADDLTPFIGAYGAEGAPRYAFNLRKVGPEQTALQFTDTETGAVRMLRPDGPGAFVAGPALSEAQPTAIRIRFGRDGVEVCPVEAGCATARRIPLRSQEITFESAGLTLHGTVWSPARAGRRPTVVLGQGSEDSDRAAMDPVPQFLAARGYVVVTYDKRGTGASPGSWADASIEVLATDLSAAVDKAREHPDVDHRRIGLMGFSEGVWVIAKAAAGRGDIAFLVSQSGGTFTKGDSYLHKMKRRFEEQGLSGDALEAAMTKERADIATSAARARSGGPASGVDRRMAYDPAPDWRRIKAPVLWMGGAWDVLEDAPASADRFGELRRGINADDKIVVFEGANHALFEAPSAKPSDWARMHGVSRYAPGVWRTLFDWLDKAAKG